MNNNITYKPLSIWLLIGVIMIFVQVLIGGITRLTDSGLSITEWKIVEGTLPPLNAEDWNSTFEEYKTHAKKQYESLHPNMELKEFKRIYFWEYFHRLWARSMFLIFIVGFFTFLFMKKMSRKLIGQLLIVIALASLEGMFGWIMVSSGLNEDSRTWVSAYKLIIHLIIATLLFSYLCWTYYSYTMSDKSKLSITKKSKGLAWSILPVLLLQIMFGGLMAGMHAGVVLPHFPSWLYLDKISNAFQQPFSWTPTSLLNYEPSVYIKMIVQLVHRATALIIVVQVFVLFFQLRKIPITSRMSKASLALIILVASQFLLGVLTVIGSVSKTPVVLGVLHQGLALVFLAALVFVLFLMKLSPQNSR